MESEKIYVGIDISKERLMYLYIHTASIFIKT